MCSRQLVAGLYIEAQQDRFEAFSSPVGNVSNSKILPILLWSRSACWMHSANSISVMRACSCCAVTLSTTTRSICSMWSFNWCWKAKAQKPPTFWYAMNWKRNPTLIGFDKLIEARLLFASPETRPDLDLSEHRVGLYPPIGTLPL